MTKFRLTGAYVLAVILLFAGCRRAARWDVDVAAPLFSTQMSLSDIDQVNLIQNQNDSSFTLVYDELVYSSRFQDVKTPDTTINTSFTLRRLKLSDRSISQTITLGQINPIFKLLNGQTAEIPAQNQSNLAPVDIDASAFFETATLDSGFLDISINNQLPVNVSLVVFEITNADDNSLVALDSFANIPKNGSVTKSVSLAGKTVNKTLKGTIKRLITESSNGPVLIDANKGVEVVLKVRNLKPRSAIAAFPNQTVLDQDEGLSVPMDRIQMKYFKARSGNLHVRVESTIQENMTMYFAIPSATKDGNILERTVKLPGATSGKAEIQEEIIPLNGYLIDFRGKNPDVKDTVNTFHQILNVTLDSSGRKVKITLNDSIRIYYYLEEMEAEYAIGYLGKVTNATGPGKAPFSLFKGVDGNLVLDDFKASILLKNYVGAEGRIKVNSLEAENIFNGNKTVLNATPLQSDIYIQPAPFVRGQYSEKEVILDGNNSNIRQFVETLPQMLNYNLDIETNPNGNVSGWKDFAFEDSRVDVFLRLETPASLSMGGITLRDTQAVQLETIKNRDRIKSATLLLDIENNYPFEVSFDLVFLDEMKNPIGSADFVNGNTVAPGKVSVSGQPLGKVQSQLTVAISREKSEIIKRARYVAIKARINGVGTKQKIYNTYTIKIKSTARFEYEANL